MRIYSWEYGFVLLTVGIAAGCWLSPIVWALVILIEAVALLLGWLFRKYLPVLLLAVFLIGGLLLSLRISPLPPVLEPETVTLTGKVTQVPAQFPDYQQTLLKCAESGYYEQIVLYLPAAIKINTGDFIQVTGKLSTLKGARNPGDPDRRRIKGYQRLYYQLKADADDIHILRTAGPSWRDRWYQTFTRQADRWMPDRLAAILISIVWGDAAALNEDDYVLFQETGLLHVFAASGLNVGCLLLAASLIIGLLSRSRNLKVGIGLVLTLIYTILIGWPVSMLRAALMALLASMAYLGGRKVPLKESLFLAAVVLLVIEPGWLFTPGFQLTIAATWGLMVLSPALTKWWFPQNSNRLIRFLLPVLAAELAVWPLTTYYFNLVAPISLAANLLLAPLISLAVILGILALFFCPLPIFFIPCRYLLEMIMTVTAWMHTLPGGYWWVKSPPLLLVFLSYFLLWLLTFPVKSPKYHYLAGGLVVVVTLFFSWPRVPDGRLAVTFVDVGQGDCIHISTPAGRQVLIDGGGSANYPVGRLIVSPYLHRQGINYLDLIINTHPHDDHLLGLKEVMQTTPYSQLVMPLALRNSPITVRALTRLPGSKPVGRYLQTGDTIRLDNQTRLRVLSPDEKQTGDVNNSSLVLELSYQGMNMLLMGDAEAPVAERLLAQPGLPVQNVIKIGHHGSSRSMAPDFYQDMQPSIAIISVGKNNGFGHPSPALVQQLQDQGIEVLRTDLMGGIRITAQRGQLAVNTYARP